MEIGEGNLKGLEEIVREIIDKIEINMEKVEESKRKFDKFRKEFLGKVDEYRENPIKLLEDLKDSDHISSGWIERSESKFSDVDRVIEYIHRILLAEDKNERKNVFKETLKEWNVTGFQEGKFVRLTHILYPEMVLPVIYGYTITPISEKVGTRPERLKKDPDMIIKISEALLNSFKELWKSPEELSDEEYALALGYALMKYSTYYKQLQEPSTKDKPETGARDDNVEQEGILKNSSDLPLYEYLRSRGYLFPTHLVAQFYAALKTKGFVILSGLTGSGKTKMALEFAELLGEVPQLMVASGPDMKAEEEVKAIKKTIGDIGYAIYGWKPAGKAKDVDLPFILWVYDSNKNDTKCYQKVPYGLFVVDRILKEELPESWKEGMNWVEKAYEDEDVDSYIEYHEIFLRATKIIECGKIGSQFWDVEKKQPVRSSDMSGGGFLKVKAPKDCINNIEGFMSNYIFLSVRPDWRDSKPLLGYYNPLDGEYYKTPLLEFILNAIKDYKQNKENAAPYFILLDEMNLAHVEYYFADFLSVLESGRDESGFTRESIKLHDVDKVEKEQRIPREIRLPPNLYIIGTVNMDETTYSFSPKVLDRAFTIEFHDVDLERYPLGETKLSQEELENLRKNVLEDLRRDGKFLAASKQEDIGEALEELKNAESEKYWQILKQLNEALEPYDLHFGYRVVDEIALFFKNAKDSQEKGKGIITFESQDEIFDLAILMKILPKFHGNRKKLEKPLLLLLKLAKEGMLNKDDAHKKADELFNELFRDIFRAGDIRERTDVVITELTNPDTYVLRHTAKKVLRMLRQLYEVGFASFS